MPLLAKAKTKAKIHPKPKDAGPDKPALLTQQTVSDGIEQAKKSADPSTPLLAEGGDQADHKEVPETKKDQKKKKTIHHQPSAVEGNTTRPPTTGATATDPGPSNNDKAVAVKLVAKKKFFTRKPKAKPAKSTVGLGGGQAGIDAGGSPNGQDSAESQRHSQQAHNLLAKPSVSTTGSTDSVTSTYLHRARPLLPALSPQVTPANSPRSSERDQVPETPPVAKAGDVKKPMAKKKVIKRKKVPKADSNASRTSVTEGVHFEVHEDPREQPLHSFNFRFFNYNMANRTEATMDDIIVGFDTLRGARKETELSDYLIFGDQPTNAADPESSTWVHAEKAKASDDNFKEMASIASSTTSKQTNKAPCTNFGQLLMSGTVRVLSDPIRRSREHSGMANEGRSRAKTEGVVRTEGNIEEGRSRARTSGNGDFGNTLAPKAGKKKKATVRLASTADTVVSGESAFTPSTSCEMAAVVDTKSTTPKGQRGHPKHTGILHFGKVITDALSMTGKSSEKKRSGFMPTSRSVDVDCAFCVLCETPYPLEEFAEVLNTCAFNAEAQTMSARHMSSEGAGVISSIYGTVAESVVGDLKTLTLVRDSFEEVTQGRIFSTYEDGGNLMKSFLGRTFDVNVSDDGRVRFIFLGTHFPMKKIASIMQGTDMTGEETVHKLKSMFARLLQKVLRHLLVQEILNERSIVILQGDLNSRCIKYDGQFIDILTETLDDVRLQQWMSLDMPPDLRGEWREVVQVPQPGMLPVTYRFDTAKASTAEKGRFHLQDVYNESNGKMDYRQVFEQLNSLGIVADWGLTAQHPEDFRPSRLPACTERVLWYAPNSLGDCCEWKTAFGYEVNYMKAGSDHKPVMLEATLNIHHGRDNMMCQKSSLLGRVASATCVPHDFEKRFLHGTEVESSEESDTGLKVERGLAPAALAPAVRGTPSILSGGSKGRRRKSTTGSSKRTAVRCAITMELAE